jgi:cytochrome c oxidase assembly protein subunit 11
MDVTAKNTSPDQLSVAQKNQRLALRLSLGVLFMLALSFASVPLYDLFCRVTGFGGTTQVAGTVPKNAAIARSIEVRFNTDISPDLLWSFKAEQTHLTLKVGEAQDMVFHAKNIGSIPSIGTAVYNVSPPRAGLYFNKVQCFCFDDHMLGVGESASFPVQFFIDPAIDKDPQMADVKTITLSYAFFSSKSPRLAAAKKRYEEEQAFILDQARAKASSASDGQPVYRYSK